MLFIMFIGQRLNLVNKDENKVAAFERQCDSIKDSILQAKDNQEILDIINSKSSYLYIYVLDDEGKVLLGPDNNLEKTFDIEELKNQQAPDADKKYNLIYKNFNDNTLILFEGNLYSGGSISFFMIIGYLICFWIIFCLLTINREKYIEVICRGLKEISNGDFDYSIKVKGKDELSEISKSINDMNKKLKDAKEKEKLIEEEKDKFIMNISHDLRTPLTSIIGYINLIKDTEYNKEIIKKYIDIIDFKSEALNKMINDFFEYNKLNMSEVKLNKAKICINEFLRQVVTSMMVIADKETKKLNLNIENEDIYCNFDGDKMFRVMENLLINAIKYSKDNSIIYIAAGEDKGKVFMKIKNQVEDKEKININKIFESTYRGDKARRTNKGGAGLGLAISKKIIELHEGSIEAYFDKNFITFCIELHK